jgi:hypothetical protein
LKLAITGDKYQCLALLHPWNTLVKGVITKEIASAAGIESAIISSWIFKHQDLFQNALKYLILNHHVSKAHGKIAWKSKSKEQC